MQIWWLLVAAWSLAAVDSAAVMDVTMADTLVVSKPSEASTTTEASKVEVSDLTTSEPPPPLKISEMEVLSEVTLRYARTYVVTRVRNPAKQAQESTFRVLLPDTAFISGFVMTLDGKSYKAYVKEKEEAKQIYNDAVSHGISAAHIAAKARDSNHFSVSVNVEANSEAVFNLTYEELLTRRNGVYNHAINLHPGGLVPKLTVTVHINETYKINKLRVPELRTGNEIDANEDDPQYSKAIIEKPQDSNEATITFKPDLEEQKKLMEVYAEKSKDSAGKKNGVLGQFVVQYDVERPKDGEILVNDGYFVHFFAPSSLPPLSKHIVFVLDTSGSMMDVKIKQLREAMAYILSELHPTDYFSIVEFSSYVQVHDLAEADAPVVRPTNNWYNPKPVKLIQPSKGTPENIAKAKIIVDRMSADGGTDIDQALQVAIQLIKKGINFTAPADSPIDAIALPHGADAAPAKETEKVTEAPLATTDDKKDAKDNRTPKLEPTIIFLTDGEATTGEIDPKKIISRLAETNYGPNKATIFSLAFGENADRALLRKLSLRNNGFMRHIYEAGDAVLQLRDFYRQVSSPLLADVRFVYPPAQVKENSVTKSEFRTLYAGSEVVVAGRVADDAQELGADVVAICGVDDSFTRKKYRIFPKVPTARKPGAYLPLERLWAYLTIKQLLDERDAHSYDNQTLKDEDKPEKKALQIALKYSFVTELTSLVVVKPNSTKEVDAESVDKLSDEGPFMPVSAAFAPLSASYPGLSGSVPYYALAPSAISKRRGGVSLRHQSMFAPHLDSFPGSKPGTNYVPGEVHSINPLNRKVSSINQPMFEKDLLVQENIEDYDAESFTSTTPSAVATYNLQNYLWALPLLDDYSAPTATLNMTVKGTKVALKLLTVYIEDQSPKASCPRATDDKPGVCLYLTTCEPAQNITFIQYRDIYCSYQDGLAGVCCPAAEKSP